MKINYLRDVERTKKLIVNIDIDTVLVANRLTEIGHAMLYRLSAVGRAIVKNRMFF